MPYHLLVEYVPQNLTGWYYFLHGSEPEQDDSFLDTLHTAYLSKLRMDGPTENP